MKVSSVLETIAIDQQDYNPQADIFNVQFGPNDEIHDLPGGSGFKYCFRDASSSRTLYILTNANKAVGVMMLNRKRKFPIQPAYAAATIAVLPEYRNRQLAKSMYGIALSIEKMIILSGDQQTPGGRRNWASLSQIPRVTVKGFVAFPNGWFDGEDDDNGEADLVIDSIMEMGGQYIGDNGYSHYFAFDVSIDDAQRQLKAHVNTLINLYTDRFDDSGYQVGLFAKYK